MNQLSISTVICTRNRVDDLDECITSLLKQRHLPDEIVVVDASDNNLTESLITAKGKLSKIPFQYVHTSPGLTKQRNIGVNVSNGDILAFLDDDVVLEQNYFKEVMKCFESDNEVSGVGGNITNSSDAPGIYRLFRKLFIRRFLVR